MSLGSRSDLQSEHFSNTVGTLWPLQEIHIICEPTDSLGLLSKYGEPWDFDGNSKLHQQKLTDIGKHAPTSDFLIMTISNVPVWATVCNNFTRQSNHSLRQGVELLLDEAFYLVFLIVVSETEGSNSVKWLLSCLPKIKTWPNIKWEAENQLVKRSRFVVSGSNR